MHVMSGKEILQRDRKLELSENSNDGVYLGYFIGRHKLTFGASDVAGVLSHLNDLNEVDPVDEISPLNVLLDHMVTMDAAVNVKYGTASPAPKPTQSPDGGFTPGGYDAPSEGPSCGHGPMKWRQGVSKAGKPYKGWFCTAPYGQNQCSAQFVK